MRVQQGCHTKIVETNLLTRFRLIEFQGEIGVWGKAPFLNLCVGKGTFAYDNQ